MKRKFNYNKVNKYLSEISRSGIFSSRYGEMTHRFEQAFAELMGVNFAVAVNSGTSALHVALKACGIGGGDEVIVPALGPTMTAQAVVLAGATPVFADIDPETFCIDQHRIGHVPFTKVRAIIPVHLFGNYCDMEAILEFKELGVAIIEDSAQMVDPDKGLVGDIGAFSLEQSKQICTGDGGFCLTNDPKLAKKMRQFADNGVDCVTASDGRVKGDVGFDFIAPNYQMSELTAALGLAQIDDFPDKMWSVQHRPMDASVFEKNLIDFGITYNRKPWDELVYQHPIFYKGGQVTASCPVAEKIHPDLFVLLDSEKDKLKRMEGL